MSAARMLPPHVMAEHYGLRWGPLDHRATPAQRRRLRQKLRRIYGMYQADRQDWISYWRARGVKIP